MNSFKGVFKVFNHNAEVYSIPCQTSKMEHFARKLIGSYLLTNFAKRSFLDI